MARVLGRTCGCQTWRWQFSPRSVTEWSVSGTEETDGKIERQSEGGEKLDLLVMLHTAAVWAVGQRAKEMTV